MKTLSPSKECSRTEDKIEYDRVVKIAVEYCREHPTVTIAAGLRAGGDHFLMLGILGERKRRAQSDFPRGVTREELRQWFGDAAGIEPAEWWES